ncbi:MAG TPA: hypothetical protein VEJ87_05065 [Acidimicrobiales bacterium]|nr:hypothetical protein [Acidimicrobiales bacterium]
MHVLRRFALAGVVATTAVATGVGVGYGVASASSSQAASKSVTAGAIVNGGKAKPGWQGDITFDVPTGTTNLFYHYACPTGEVAISGGYHPLTDAGTLQGSFPRTDITPLYSAWGWVTTWSGAGSPSGQQIVFDVYCGK